MRRRRQRLRRCGHEPRDTWGPSSRERLADPPLEPRLEGVRPWGTSILDSWLQSWEMTTSLCFQPQSLGCLLWPQDTSAPFSHPPPCGMFRTPQAARPRVPHTLLHAASLLLTWGFQVCQVCAPETWVGWAAPSQGPGPSRGEGADSPQPGLQGGITPLCGIPAKCLTPSAPHPQLPCPGRPPEPRPLSGHLMSFPQTQMPARLVSAVHYFSHEK